MVDLYLLRSVCLFLPSAPENSPQSDRQRFIKIPFEKCVDTCSVNTHSYTYVGLVFLQEKLIMSGMCFRE